MTWSKPPVSHSSDFECKCVTCESEPNAIGPGCDCMHAPCVHDTNRLRAELAAMTAERDKESADLKARLMSEARLRAEPVKCDGSCNGTEFGDCSDPGHVSGVLKGAVR